MSQYKHIYNAIDNAMKNLKQAQECCDDIMHLDKESCGSWKKQIKDVEKQLGTCYKKVEGKHKKGAGSKRVRTASVDKLLNAVFGQDGRSFSGYEEDDQEELMGRLKFKKRAKQDDEDLDSWDDEDLDSWDDEDLDSWDDEEYGRKNSQLNKRAKEEDDDLDSWDDEDDLDSWDDEEYELKKSNFRRKASEEDTFDEINSDFEIEAPQRKKTAAPQKSSRMRKR
jgi:hypothetical protein